MQKEFTEVRNLTSRDKLTFVGNFLAGEQIITLKMDKFDICNIQNKNDYLEISSVNLYQFRLLNNGKTTLFEKKKKKKLSDLLLGAEDCFLF